MVMQSVNKSGVLPFAKSAVLNNCPPAFRDNNVSLQVALPHEHPFFTLGVSFDPNNVKCYSVVPANGLMPAVERAFLSSSSVYVEAVRPLSQHNKHALTSVLEFADEAGCESVFACVKKNNAFFADILRSFTAAGFHSVSPLNSDMVKLCFVV